jgi:hypothetical protein
MNEDLRKWFKEKWVDISRKKKGGGHPACGASADKGVRAKDSSRKYPKCVPANKAKNMSKKEKKSAVSRKRRAPNEPGSPDNVKTDLKESWENWRPSRDRVYSGGAPSNNAPEDPRPMGGAVAFEKSRREVLSQLKEYIQYLVMEAVYEAEDRPGPRTIPPPFRRGRIPAPPPRDPVMEGIRRIFQAGEFTREDIDSIASHFYNIIKNKESEKYADFIQGLPNTEQFNDVIDNRLEQLGYPEGEASNIQAIVARLGHSIEFELGRRESRLTSPSNVTATPRPPSRKSPRQVTQTMNLPSQSDEFVRAVGDYRKMVADYVSDPIARQRITDELTQIQFDPDMSEAEKEGRIINSIERNVRGTNLNENSLPRKVRHLIIKSVLKEKKLYG